MPNRPARPCSYPGCPALVRGSDSRCPRHPRATIRRSPSATGGQYADTAWRQLRARVLAEEPTCRFCGQPASHVDHVVKVSDRPDLRLDRSNLRALCASCHNRRTATEQARTDGRWGSR